MVTISITAEAYAAIRLTLPKGVRAKPRLDEGGGFKIRLDRRTLDRLAALRRAGESYSDVIVAWRAVTSRASAVGIQRRGKPSQPPGRGPTQDRRPADP
jgi:hypothetical protein